MPIPDVDDFPPPSWGRRLLTLLLALAVAGVVMFFVLRPPTPVPPHLVPPIRDAKPCIAGQTSECVGGMASVIVAPQAASAAASR